PAMPHIIYLKKKYRNGSLKSLSYQAGRSVYHRRNPPAPTKIAHARNEWRARVRVDWPTATSHEAPGRKNNVAPPKHMLPASGEFDPARRWKHSARNTTSDDSFLSVARWE